MLEQYPATMDKEEEKGFERGSPRKSRDFLLEFYLFNKFNTG